MKKLTYPLLAMITFVAPTAWSDCLYNGQTYGQGSVVCMSGYEYRCNSGSWDSLGTACGDSSKETSKTQNLMVPLGMKKVVDLHASPASRGAGVMVQQRVQIAGKPVASASVSCTCTDDSGKTHTATKTCPSDSGNTCDCSNPASPQITCGP